MTDKKKELEMKSDLYSLKVWKNFDLKYIEWKMKCKYMDLICMDKSWKVWINENINE